MKAVFESVRDGVADSAIHLYRRDDPEFEFYWHYHPEYELTYISHGRGQRTVGNHIARFQPGDLVLVGSGLPHTWVSDPEDRGRPHRALVIQFSEALFAPLLERPEYRAIAALLQRADTGLAYAESAPAGLIATLVSMDQQSPLERLLTLTRVLDQLAALPGQALATANYSPSADPQQEDRMQRILRYLQEQGRGRVSSAAVARQAHLSPHSFSRYFRRHTKKTFSTYLTELRLGWACTALLETDLPVAQVAFQSGFQNLSNFNRLFRRERGMTPLAYRRRLRGAG